MTWLTVDEVPAFHKAACCSTPGSARLCGELDKHGGTGSIAFGEFPGFIDAVQDLALVNTRRNRAPRPLVLHDVAQPDYVRGVIAQARR